MQYFGRGSDVIPRNQTTKYYLIDLDNEDPRKISIYLLEVADAMDQVHQWVMRNSRELEAKSNVARIPQINPWCNQLQQFGKDGHAVSYEADDVGRAEYEKLTAIFRKHGKRVGTVPGRKPPKPLEDSLAIPIDWDVDTFPKK